MFGNIFKKEEVVIKPKQPEINDSPSVYIVRWLARYGSFPSERQQEVKVCKSKQEAEDFGKQLIQAAETLRYREPFKIFIEEIRS